MLAIIMNPATKNRTVSKKCSRKSAVARTEESSIVVVGVVVGEVVDVAPTEEKSRRSVEGSNPKLLAIKVASCESHTMEGTN